jgi:hypothetical protein
MRTALARSKQQTSPFKQGKQWSVSSYVLKGKTSGKREAVRDGNWVYGSETDARRQYEELVQNEIPASLIRSGGKVEDFYKITRKEAEKAHYFKGKGPKRANPESAAADLYEEFHGAPADVVEEIHYVAIGVVAFLV